MIKKIVAIILAGLIISSALAGCGITEEELDYILDSAIADIQDNTVATTPPATEPVATAPVVETVPETVAPVEPAPSEGWEYGDEVWFVEWSEGGGWPYPGIVIDAGEEHLIVSRGWSAEGELIVAALGDCYRTYDEAWAATGKAVVAGEGCG